MPRTVAIGQQVEGINLRRFKGGADPSGLFDLLNAWVTPKGTIKRRPGTRTVVNLGAAGDDMRGLFAFDGKFHTFIHYVTPNPDPQIEVHVLRHPTGGVAALTAIHKVFAFLGRLYVVAEFADGVVRHYYLNTSSASPWQANTPYRSGSRVVPTTQNGFEYEASPAGGVSAPDAWRPNVEVPMGVGDPPFYVQPTIANGFKYYVNAAFGTTPFKTSNHEPNWPLVEFETVLERRYVTEPQVDSGQPGPPTEDGPPRGYGPYPPIRPDELPPTHER